MGVNTSVNDTEMLEIIKDLCISPKRISDNSTATDFITEKILADFLNFVELSNAQLYDYQIDMIRTILHGENFVAARGIGRSYAVNNFVDFLRNLCPSGRDDFLSDFFEMYNNNPKDIKIYDYMYGAENGLITSDFVERLYENSSIEKRK